MGSDEPRENESPSGKARPPGKKYTSMESLPADEIIRAYQGGESLRKIAGTHGTSENMIRRLLDKHGVSRRSRDWKLGKDDKSFRAGLKESLPAERIISAYQAGASIASLAQTYGVSHTTIVGLMDDRGQARRSSRAVPWTGRSRVLSPDQEADVVRRYEEGESQNGIARSLGVSSPTIRAVLRRHGKK